MTNDKTLALQLKDLLTICLAKAIDTALLAEAGTQWFRAFAKDDASPEHKVPILQQGQSSIYNCDLQALMKFLRYRPYYADTVLNHFGFITFDETYENRLKKDQFSHLLNRLITDFRNRMEAHVRASDIENISDSSLYDYADAIKDMLKLAEIFRSVNDRDGRSYFDRMKQLCSDHETQKNTCIRPLDDVISSLGDRILKADILHACEKLGITLITVDGVLCVSSTDYDADLTHLRTHLAITKAAHRGKKRAILLAVLAAVVVIMGIIGAIIWIHSLPPAPEDNFYRDDSAVTYRADRIDLIARHIYWDGDELVAECAVINGCSATLSPIRVNSFSISNEDGVIARKDFGVIADRELPQKSHIMWTFRFDKDCVFIPDADLTKQLSISAHIPAPAS